MLSWKHESVELRLLYPKLLESAFAASLTLVILMFILSGALISPAAKPYAAPEVVLKTVDVPITIQKKMPAPPMRPSQPIIDATVDLEADIPAAIYDFETIPEFAPPPRPVSEEVYEYYAVEKAPVLVGGTAALYQYIASHNLYPKLALESRLAGAAQVEFVVGTDGVPHDVVILDENPPGLGFGEATVLAIQAMRFEPGMQRDRAVPVKMTQAIRFVVD